MPVSDWQIPREDRKAILAGTRAPITVADKPPLEIGDKLILSWLRPKPYADPELGRGFRPDPKPEFWIIVTEVRRKKKEGWSVAYEVHDYRDPTRWLRLQSGVDPPERVSKEIERDFSKAARERERAAANELIAEALIVRELVSERLKSRQEFRALAGLSIRRLDKEVNRLINHTRRKAA